MSTVPIVSGGLDSVTMVYDLVANGHDIPAIVSFDYGQRHKRELECARLAARAHDAAHVVVNLQAILASVRSALTSSDVEVPDGHYAEESMRSTVVPGRNLLLIAAAVPVAARYDADTLAVGVHGGDHFIYPDCRHEFIEPLSHAVLAGYGMFLLAPFISVDKQWIAARAHELHVPIRDTWSCYRGGPYHCGTCGTCVERREAFALAGIEDPTDYLNEPPIPAHPGAHT